MTPACYNIREVSFPSHYVSRDSVFTMRYNPRMCA